MGQFRPFNVAAPRLLITRLSFTVTRRSFFVIGRVEFFPSCIQKSHSHVCYEPAIILVIKVDFKIRLKYCEKLSLNVGKNLNNINETSANFHAIEALEGFRKQTLDTMR